MKIGIIIETNNPESCWNAVRFGNTALKKSHSVKIFLMGSGVEIESISTAKFNTITLLEEFQKNKGQILACGTCLKSRNQSESSICPISTMNDCVDMVEWADRVITF